MTIVDSSVWIDFLRGTPTRQVELLKELVRNGNGIIVGDLILAEVLQGVTSDQDFDKTHALLRAFPVVELCGHERAVRAARNYRLLRRHGVTPRKTIDTLIATACLDRGDELLYSDRDFDPFVEHLGLKSALKAQPS